MALTFSWNVASSMTPSSVMIPAADKVESQIGELNLGRLNSLRKFYGNLPPSLCAAGRPRRPMPSSGRDVSDATEQQDQPDSGHEMLISLAIEATAAGPSSPSADLKLRITRVMRPTIAARATGDGQIELASFIGRHGSGAPLTTIAPRLQYWGLSRRSHWR